MTQSDVESASGPSPDGDASTDGSAQEGEVGADVPRPDDVDSPFALVREIVDGPRDLSLKDVAERSGLPLEILRELFKASDRTDRDRFSEEHVEYAKATAAMLDHYPLGTVVRALRVRNRAVTSIVVNDLAAVRDHVVQPAVAQGASTEDIAGMLGQTAEDILPKAADTLGLDYRDVLRRLLELDVVESAATDAEGRLVVAVGFVDVVGYTALSARVDPSGLDEILGAFEDLVTQIAADREDVMLTKFIGDAAMLVAQDPVELAGALYDIVTAKEELAGAPRSAGMAAGAVLVREGDYVGRPANMAARLTDLARSGSVLADEDLAEDLEDAFDLTRIPETELRGIGKRRPLRVRPREED